MFHVFTPFTPLRRPSAQNKFQHLSLGSEDSRSFSESEFHLITKAPKAHVIWEPSPVLHHSGTTAKHSYLISSLVDLMSSSGYTSEPLYCVFCSVTWFDLKHKLAFVIMSSFSRTEGHIINKTRFYINAVGRTPSFLPMTRKNSENNILVH